MCQHPRCGQRGYYELTDTPYGPRFELCKLHGEQYQEKHGGTLKPMYPAIQEKESNAN